MLESASGGGGVLHAGGVSPCWGGVLPAGGRGGSPCRGGGSLENPPLWTEWMTDTCKNITLATTSLRPVKILMESCACTNFHCSKIQGDKTQSIDKNYTLKCQFSKNCSTDSNMPSICNTDNALQRCTNNTDTERDRYSLKYRELSQLWKKWILNNSNTSSYL